MVQARPPLEPAVHTGLSEAFSLLVAELDSDELAELCAKLGSTLSTNQLEVFLRSLDKDHNGTVSLDEFLIWYAGGNAEEAAPQTLEQGEGAVAGVTTSPSSAPAPAPASAAAAVDLVRMKAEATRHPPTVLRLINLLMGLAVAVSSLCAFIIGWQKVTAIQQLLPSILNVWVFLFGLFIMAQESGSWCLFFSTAGCYRALVCVGQSRSALTDHYMRFLDTVAGRGVFYFFVGSLAVCSWQKGLGLFQLLAVFAGLGVMALAVVNVIVGLRANSALSEIRGKIAENELQDAFRTADADGSGELDMAELANMIEKLGVKLDHGQWEVLVSQLDRDNSGTVSFAELKRWWANQTMI
jgi:Ca2+-binding EF-hand superfamily protein